MKKYRALCDFEGIVSMKMGCEVLLDEKNDHTKTLVKAHLIEEVKKKKPQTSIAEKE